MVKRVARAAAVKALVGAAAAAMSAKRRRGANGRFVSSRSTISKSRRAVAKRAYRRMYKRRGHRETNAPVSEYSKQSVTIGRRRKINATKIIKQNISSTVYGYRNYSQFAGSSGAIGLNNISATSTSGTYTVPCHLWEVTSSQNVVSGVVASPQILWIPTFSDPTSLGTLSWANSQTFTVENADSATSLADIYPGGSDTLDWVQFKSIFYCPTTLPCRFQVDVVQFKDTRLVPDSVTGVSSFACAFWQAMTKRFAYSPLETGDYKYQKYLKVLYSNSFILNPKESTESVNTIYRELSIFMRLNRRCTYDWEDNDRMANLSTDAQINVDGNIKTQVHPRARIYIMVRGQARNSNVYSTSIMPSYDLALRTKHSQLAS